MMKALPRPSAKVHPPIFFLPAKHTRDTEKQFLVLRSVGAQAICANDSEGILVSSKHVIVVKVAQVDQVASCSGAHQAPPYPGPLSCP